MSVAEAVATATRRVAASKVTPKRTRTALVYKNEIVILSGVAASPREAATQSKDPCPRHKLSPWNFRRPLSRQLLRQDRDPSTSPAHSQANGQIALRVTAGKFYRWRFFYARSFPPRPSSDLMICADHCATSSSRSVRSADWNRARSSSEYLPLGTLPLRKISTGTKPRN